MLRIFPIPAFEDNYIWVVQPNINTPEVYVVDPGDCQAVLNHQELQCLSVKGILLTHHHHDHIDGSEELSRLFNAPIFGPDSSKIPQVTHKLYHGSQLDLGSIQFQIIAIPGHTKDHIAYYYSSQNNQESVLLSGDTLFSIGCGRVFDSDPETLFDSIQLIRSLPDNTLIFPSHEYTLANIAFAEHLQPQNTELQQLRETIQEYRRHGKPSLPVRLGDQKRTNPFLNCHKPELTDAVAHLIGKHLTTEKSVFVAMRYLKNHF